MKKSPVEKHFDTIAKDYDYYKSRNKFYYDNLKALLKKLIPKNKKVLEVGCGTGDLLVSLNPKFGYGFDISGEMIEKAKSKYYADKNLIFSKVWPENKFDYIIMSDVIEHLEKPEETISKLAKLMDYKTIFVNTMMNPAWEPIEKTYTLLGLKMPEGPHNRIKYNDLKILTQNAGMKIVKHDYKLLMPIKIPIITDLSNIYLEKYLRPMAFIEYIVAVKEDK